MVLVHKHNDSARETVTAGSQQQFWCLLICWWYDSRIWVTPAYCECSKQTRFSSSSSSSKHLYSSVTQAQRLPVCILKCGEGSSLRSRRSGTDPCWRWCCEGRTAGPQPLGSLWAPAERWARARAFAHRACRLSRGRWKAGDLVHFMYRIFSFFFFFFPTCLSRWLVKQRFRSLSMYLLQDSTARGLESTVIRETGPSCPTLCFFSSLSMYTPDISLPWVPPQMAMRDSGGKRTRSICWEKTFKSAGHLKSNSTSHQLGCGLIRSVCR